MRRIVLLAAVSALGLSAAPASASTVFSEDFSGGFGQFSNTDPAIVVTQAQPGYVICCSATGSNLTNPFVAFGGGEQQVVGSISATFATVANQLYTLAFRAGAFGGGSSNLTYSINGAPTTFSVFANNNTDSTFLSYLVNFVGTGNSTTLSFTTTDAGSGIDPVLDDVVVASVPEPGIWAMMIIGFGMIGGALRRKRTQALRTA